LGSKACMESASNSGASKCRSGGQQQQQRGLRESAPSCCLHPHTPSQGCVLCSCLQLQSVPLDNAALSPCSRAAPQPTLTPSCCSTRVALTCGFQGTAVLPCLVSALRHAGLDMCREMNCLRPFLPFLLSSFVLVIESLRLEKSAKI